MTGTAPPVRRTLWRGGRVVTAAAASAGATAVVAAGGILTFVGSDADAADIGPFDNIVDLDGAWVAPAFVDAHVHLTATGLAEVGLDLSGCRSGAAVLDAVDRWTRHLAGGPVIGHGWDEENWADATLPRRTELDRAGGGRPVYLARIDLHAALVSTALLHAVPGVTTLDGYAGDGHVVAQAHDATRAAAYGFLTAAQRRAGHRAARARAARAGVALIHELAGPQLSSAEDMVDAIELSRDEPGPEIVAYWGELGGAARARELGALGAAGDIFADGTLGSHTACLRRVYDDLDSRGCGYVTVAQVREHVAACTEEGLQAGFHAIGDASLDTVVAGFEEAADRLGLAAIQACRHRIEHVEMVDDRLIARMARLGVYASVQPAFDAAWGGPSGLYAARLGQDRAATMNPLAPLAAAGIPLVFGSDSPVTPIDPWGTIRAAVRHRRPEYAISPEAAFEAHTLAGWRSAGRDHGGVLTVGSPATFAVWYAPDASSFTDVLLADRNPLIRATVRDGAVILDAADFTD